MTPDLDDPPVDVPPPPYSETDIYSNSAGRSPVLGQFQTLPIRQRTASHSSLNAVHANDDASSAASNGEIIYTPPLTPHSSHSNIQPFQSPNSAGSNDCFLSPGYPNDQQNSISVASDRLTSASAEAYFESRPVPAGLGSPRELRHTITIWPGSSPDSFPYQQEWADRDVRPDDWRTFLNYLLPNHVAENNEALIDRKLRAEGLENTDEARSVQSEKGSAIAGGRSPVVAQLAQIHMEDQSGQSVDETVREWNEGFFEPRGMTIHVEQSTSAQEGPRMPGSWDQSFNTSPPPAQPQPQQQQQQQHTGSGNRWWRSLPRFETSNRGLRFGGVSIDNDRISIGDNFMADSRGLRIGGLVADDNGLRLHGRDLFGSTHPRARGPLPAPPGPLGPHNPPPMPPMPPTSAMPPMPTPQGYAHASRHLPPPLGFEPHLHPFHRNEDTSRRADHRPPHHSEPNGRGRLRLRQGLPPRHRSSSSASSLSSLSSSSSSSSDSNSSIGSLPDAHDLHDSQLPVARAYLEAWLAHPEHAVSRATVQEAKGTIQAAVAAKQQSSHLDDDGPNNPVAAEERQALRALLGEWARVKRQQKTTRRQRRREKKALRRAARRERRQTRLARREAKREGREARREARRERRAGSRQHRGGGGGGGGWHDRRGGGGFGSPHHSHCGPRFGPRRQHVSFGGGDGHHTGFPGAGFGPGGARRGGGAFPFLGGGGGGRGGAFQPADARGPWPPRFPGAWPSDDAPSLAGGQDALGDEKSGRRQETGVGEEKGWEKEKSAGGVYPVSAALFRELEARRTVLDAKQCALSDLTEDKGQQQQALKDGKGDAEEKPPKSAALIRLLNEMEELESAVRRLALKADEQYARELMMMEDSREYPEWGA